MKLLANRHIFKKIKINDIANEDEARLILDLQLNAETQKYSLQTKNDGEWVKDPPKD